MFYHRHSHLPNLTVKPAITIDYSMTLTMLDGKDDLARGAYSDLAYTPNSCTRLAKFAIVRYFEPCLPPFTVLFRNSHYQCHHFGDI